jgi:hypothetical protein
MNRSAAEIIQEYGPFPGADGVHGVTYNGQQIWFADGDKLNAVDPASGKMLRPDPPDRYKQPARRRPRRQVGGERQEERFELPPLNVSRRPLRDAVVAGIVELFREADPCTKRNAVSSFPSLSKPKPRT